MAEFSKEYANTVDWSDYDFSYLEIFDTLEEGHYFPAICEGLGTFGIHKKNGVPYLVITYDGELAEFSTFMTNFKKIQELKDQKKKH